MKKYFVILIQSMLIFLFTNTQLVFAATFSNILTDINNSINTINRVQYTSNRIKDTAEKYTNKEEENEKIYYKNFVPYYPNSQYTNQTQSKEYMIPQQVDIPEYQMQPQYPQPIILPTIPNNFPSQNY